MSVRARPILVALFVALLAGAAHADQYHSEQQLGAEQSASTHESLEQRLRTTKNPYARAMLLRSLAAAAAQHKQYAKAATWLQKALDENALSAPAQTQMRKQLTALRTASGDPKSVIAALAPLARKNPNLPADELVALGTAYAATRRYQEALPLLERGVAAVRNPPARWLKALVAAQIGSGHADDAIPVIQRLLNLTPDDRAAWLRLAKLQIQAGDRRAALVTYQLALRLGYLSTESERLRLVALTARLGAPFQAASQLKRWIAGGQVTKTAEHWQTVAALWAQARARQRAVDAYQEAARLQPQASGYRQIGRLELELRRNAAAAKALQNAVRLGDHGGTTHMTLGLAYYRAGDLERAQAAFTRAAKAGGKAGHSARQWLAWLKTDAARRRARMAKPGTALPPPAALTDVFTAAPVELGPNDRASEPPVVALQARPPPAAAAATAGRLTPVGAVRAGSADGTIPPWVGGLTRSHWPAGWHSGEHLKDPFPQDKPLFVVTAANVGRYRKYLAPGYLALFRKYPDYRMKVYPARRTVSYPKAIYRATQANIGRARLLGPDALVGARLGFPFPQPDNGVEVMWNHRVRYRGGSLRQESTQAVVEPGSAPQYLHQTELVYSRYADIADPVDIDKDNILLDYLTTFGRDKGGVDFLALVHETANSLEQPRAMWVMPPHMARLFRIPPVGYDQPFPGSHGLYFLDMVDMYNGPFNRYVWKLAGKREMLIPYNDYRVSDGRYRYDQLLGPQHFDQDAVRYEMHRVWVVEATLREGQHHAFGKRVFYLDEDSWNVVLVDNYDHQGHLWRFQEGHLLPLYGVQAAACEPVVTYDLKSGAYFVNHLIGRDAPAQFHLKNLRASDFAPATVKARYAH